MATPDRNKAGTFLGLATPYLWESPSTREDSRLYVDIEIQVVGVPAVAYVPQRSFDGTTFVNAYAYDLDGNPLSSIVAAGFYRLLGGSWVKLATGSGSTIYIRKGS